MKKLFAAVILSLAAIVCLAGCEGKTTENSTFELAVVTDVGQLMDGGFNQGTYEGVKEFAEQYDYTYKYYQPQNGSDATDNDRIAAMRQAVKNGAKVIVAPGFLQAAAMAKVAEENPEVRFVFVDGWSLTDSKEEVLQNVTAIVYKEEESGYLAGYGAVMDGFTKLGGTFGGGGSNPACNRFAYGFVQGANDAAAELEKQVEVKISYQFGSTFSASNELQTQIGNWYNAGTEVVFSCGGSMVNSVIAAAEAQSGKWVIGVDTDQSALSQKVLTSAFKGLAVSVSYTLRQMYTGQWATKLAGKTQTLGATKEATGLPTAEGSWRFRTWKVADYEKVYADIVAGNITISNKVADDCNTNEFWGKLSLSNCTVIFE